MRMAYSETFDAGNADASANASMYPVSTGAGELRKERRDRPIGVLIVDDHELVRRGLRALLAANPGVFEICGEAASGHEAVKKARHLRPDVVVLDVSMPGLNGLDAAREIRQGRSRAKILMLSQHDPAQLLPRAIQAGAQACVDKSRLGADLLPAIEKVA